METSENIIPPSYPDPCARLYAEAAAMAEHAFSLAKEVPPKAIITLQNFVQYLPGKEPVTAELLSDMIWSHHALAQLLAPATPRTILLLHAERAEHGLLNFLGPVSLIRQLMLVALTSLLVFILTCLSPYTNYTYPNPYGNVDRLSSAMSPNTNSIVPAAKAGRAISIMTSDGLPLLVVLVQYLGAAGLGASFACLYRANRFVTAGTFDPMYTGSYWIRFFLGLISGLLLAVIMRQDTLQSSVLEPGIDRVLLAILGGFSADLFYTFLSRFADACKSIFQGAAEETIAVRVQQAKTQLAARQLQNQAQLAASLMRVNQTIGTNTSPEEIKRLLNELMNEVLPPKPPGH